MHFRGQAGKNFFVDFTPDPASFFSLFFRELLRSSGVTKFPSIFGEGSCLIQRFVFESCCSIIHEMLPHRLEKKLRNSGLAIFIHPKVPQTPYRGGHIAG